jgi:hypothetical protein
MFSRASEREKFAERGFDQKTGEAETAEKQNLFDPQIS